MTRTTLSLDDDIYRIARALAETSGRPLGRVVSELARRGLAPRQPARSATTLPVFEVAPDAEIIPVDRARELLADEGVA
ncbi:MAG: antitoxin [Deltaproteobacteria bacterium]|nr:antitoxin [Deltaproteobacteria bacterium]